MTLNQFSEDTDSAPDMISPLTPGTHPALFLAGPMTGRPNFNYDAFHSAALRLRALGFLVCNPADAFGGDQSLPYETYLRKTIRDVTDSDAVAVLPGWEGSRGASIEVQVADWLRMTVVDAETLLLTQRG